ncbi:MAG: DUF1684 domain-containing protein [Chthonomonadales bacterium]
MRQVKEMDILNMLMILLTLALVATIAAGDSTEGHTYKDTINKWRAEQDADLRKPESWLSLAGLFWLQEGPNSFGSADGSVVVIPHGEGPEIAGTLVRTGSTVSLNLAEGVSATIAGKPVSGDVPLKSDAKGAPDRIKMGAITFIVVVRGERIGIRMWNSKSPRRKSFEGMKWYPVDSSYRVKAKFTPYNPPKKISYLNILGDMEEGNCPGYLEFDLHGQHCRLEAEGRLNSLFLNFRDGTSGKSTYGAGRFLETASVVNGTAILDFNQAISPPCAVTDFATCPLPPRSNYLTVSIEAGEKAMQHK